MQIEDMNVPAHLPVKIHLCEVWAAERSARCESATEKKAEEKYAKKKRKRKGQTFEV